MNNLIMGLAELTFYTDPKTKKQGRIFRPFYGETEKQITEFIKYYSGKYGILQAKTISKEEYESAIANNK
jgi:hypothetical protein